MPDKIDINDFTSFINMEFQYYSQTYLDVKKNQDNTKTENHK